MPERAAPPGVGRPGLGEDLHVRQVADQPRDAGSDDGERIHHHHAQAGSVPFQGRGLIRPVYFALLLSHIVLATVIVPLALTTLYQAWGGRFDRHRRIARWTLPIWLYVSVTGVLVYWMLYHVVP